MTKYLVLCLKVTLAFCSAFALIKMLVEQDYEYICLPISIIIICIWDCVSALSLDYDDNGVYDVFSSGSPYTYQSSNHTKYQPKKYVDETQKEANKLVKRGVKIEIGNKQNNDKK